MNITPIHPDDVEGLDIASPTQPHPTRRTLGRRGFPSRRTLGRRAAPSRRTLGRNITVTAHARPVLTVTSHAGPVQPVAAHVGCTPRLITIEVRGGIVRPGPPR